MPFYEIEMAMSFGWGAQTEAFRFISTTDPASPPPPPLPFVPATTAPIHHCHIASGVISCACGMDHPSSHCLFSFVSLRVRLSLYLWQWVPVPCHTKNPPKPNRRNVSPPSRHHRDHRARLHLVLHSHNHWQIWTRIRAVRKPAWMGSMARTRANHKICMNTNKRSTTRTRTRTQNPEEGNGIDMGLYHFSSLAGRFFCCSTYLPFGFVAVSVCRMHSTWNSNGRPDMKIRNENLSVRWQKPDANRRAALAYLFRAGMCSLVRYLSLAMGRFVYQRFIMPCGRVRIHITEYILIFFSGCQQNVKDMYLGTLAAVFSRRNRIYISALFFMQM